MYTIVLKKSAQKNLDSIDKRFRERITSAIYSLEVDPFVGKLLKGELQGLYSMRVWPYRVIYQIYKQQLIVHVIAVQYRQGVYK